MKRCSTTLNYQGNANKNHNVILPCIYQNGLYKKQQQQQQQNVANCNNMDEPGGYYAK